MAPIPGKSNDMAQSFTGYSNDGLIASTHGDAAKGSLTSPEFTFKEPYNMTL